MGKLGAATQVMGWVTKNARPGAVYGLLKESLSSGKGLLGSAKRVFCGSWDDLGKSYTSKAVKKEMRSKLVKEWKKKSITKDQFIKRTKELNAGGVIDESISDKVSMIKLIKLGLLGGFSLIAPSCALRTYEEGNAALHLAGNNEGSIAWSWSQAGLHAASSVMAIGGALTPKWSPLNMILRKTPILAVAPSLIALSMDYVQSFATMNSTHWAARLGQFGLDNYAINTKSGDNGVMMYKSKLFPWWLRNVRSLDEKIANKLGIDLKRPDPWLISRYQAAGQLSMAA
jgi:hypothetical protein